MAARKSASSNTAGMSLSEHLKRAPDAAPKISKANEATPHLYVRTSNEENPKARRLMEKNGANPKVADDTAAYMIPLTLSIYHNKQ